MRLALIVAMAENGIIGRGNDLPWHLSGDLAPGGSERPRRQPVLPVATGRSASTYFHDFAYHTIAFPVPSAGGDARAMGTHRQAFPTPRGSEKRDPKGGLARLPDVVARRL